MLLLSSCHLVSNHVFFCAPLSHQHQHTGLPLLMTKEQPLFIKMALLSETKDKKGRDHKRQLNIEDSTL